MEPSDWGPEVMELSHGDLESWSQVMGRVRHSYSFSFETGENVSVSHFASYRKKCQRNWRTLVMGSWSHGVAPCTVLEDLQDWSYTVSQKSGI